MKTILSSRRHHYMARLNIFLIAVALIVGTVGCGGGGGVEYDLTIASTVGGSVTTPGEAGPYTYDEGEVVNLVATPDAGYHFVEWTGDVSDVADAENATTTITMNDHYSITANFAIEIIEIWDWYDLHAIRDNLGGSYVLMNDLDATTAGYSKLASPTANEGKGWQPIGTLDEQFTGSLDGQGYEIRDVFINRPNENYVGLFGAVVEGVIENVEMVAADVTGSWNVGILVGGSAGTVSSSYSNGSVSGDGGVGGLIGGNRGSISDSYSTASVTGGEDSSDVGGLVGLNEHGTVDSSHATGDVTGQCYVGGLVGWNSYGTVDNCYSTASVSGSDQVGGLVGFNEGEVSNSYADGDVFGDDEVGGLVGDNDDIVKESYSTGSVTGEYYVGGLVGLNEGTVSNSYAVGSVSGDASVGGLVGDNEGEVSNSYADGDVFGDDEVGSLVGSNWGAVSNSYSTGSVTGEYYVGGLVGSNDGTVSNSYAIGSVSGDAGVGGLVGWNDGTVSDSFWDTETSGQSTSAGGTGKITTEMQDITTFTAWDITAVASGVTDPAYAWNIVDGQTYPFLSWQPVS